MPLLNYYRAYINLVGPEKTSFPKKVLPGGSQFWAFGVQPGPELGVGGGGGGGLGVGGWVGAGWGTG